MNILQARFKLPTSNTKCEIWSHDVTNIGSQYTAHKTVFDSRLNVCTADAPMVSFRKAKLRCKAHLLSLAKKEGVQLDLVFSGRMVRLDPVLSDVASFSGALLTWQDLISRVQSRMQHAHEVTLPGQQPTMHKGPLPPISLTVAQRTGNKKVTLVEGFETYGIDPQRLAHEVCCA